jgi:Leucine-rich repeat (LRR) protein
MKLEELDLSHNGLSGDSLHRFLRSALASPINILRVAGNSFLKPDELETFFKAFKAITFENLSHLDFSANGLTDKKAYRLYETLGQCKSLSRLDLADNNLVSCEGISMCFKLKTKFESLSLRSNRINDGGVEGARVVASSNLQHSDPRHLLYCSYLRRT